jgi:hypothetical protein
MTQLRFLSLGVVIATVTVAWADGGIYTDRQPTYRFSQGGTSLKVTEPEGHKVTLTLADGTVKTDTVPALFQLPDADAFYKVTLAAPDGTTWSKKVEIRAKYQAELGVAYKAPEAKTQEKPAQSVNFVGKLENAGHTCSDAWSRSLKLDLMRSAGGQVVVSKEIEPKTWQNVELASGHWEARMYVKTNDVWDFVATAPLEIGKDGWKYSFGCTNRMRKPSLVPQ